MKYVKLKSNQKKKRNPDGRTYGPRVGTFSRPVSRGILRDVVILYSVLGEMISIELIYDCKVVQK